MSDIHQSMFCNYPDLLDTTALQTILGISRHQVYNLINSGELRGRKIGKKYLIPKINLIDYVLGPEQS